MILKGLRSEFDIKENKIKSLMRELEELKNDQTMEEENRKFKKQKMDLENRLKEQVNISTMFYVVNKSLFRLMNSMNLIVRSRYWSRQNLNWR